METENSKLIEFMLNPASYLEKPEKITHVETHISHVFIAGNRVYKIKKPVNFGFLDFTSLSKRRFYCQREFELNSRLTKNLYLGVIPIYFSDNGYSFDKCRGAKVVEYAVIMNYIPQEEILYNKIQKGEPLLNQAVKVAKHIANFHKRIPAKVTKESIYNNTIFSCEENFEQIKPYINTTIDSSCYGKIVKYTRDFLKSKKKQFYERKKSGFIKEIHGDLHTQHICLTDPPTIFDCIEFNNRFRIDDVLNDIAFLLMDLEFNGRFDLSRIVKKHYESVYKEAMDEDFIKFYKIYRAVVRGKVEGFISENYRDGKEKNSVINKAKDYFRLAKFYVEEKCFNPIVFWGVSGSGKSSLAKEFNGKYEIIRSDEIRKRISGLKLDEHQFIKYQSGIYAKEMTEKTYKTMLEEMLNLIKNGKSVILDATFIKRWQREMLINICESQNLIPFFIQCVAPKELLIQRVRNRKVEGIDISDAHEEILLKQIESFEEPEDVPSFIRMKIDTSFKKEEILLLLKELL